MDLVLNRFDHYFSIEGRRGELSSTVWDFRQSPGSVRAGPPGKRRAAMRSAFGSIPGPGCIIAVMGNCLPVSGH